MNDSSAREMNERQPQRPCGCVGIFFQLFDRNRRFAKKLFPKKLLSPACLKQASKKFGGDEKQPKLRGYRMQRMKRIAEMREVAKIVRFVSVTPISGADFVREVVFPYKSDIPRVVWNPPLTGREAPNPSVPQGLECVIKVNVLACKDPKSVKADDFYFSGLQLAGNTSNTFGSKVTAVNVAQVPGLNALGITLACVDYAPWAINPLHTHPRATEILTVLEGSLQVGFVTCNPENHLITKVLTKGDVFVFPIGLVHYQHNVGYGNAVAIAALSSQNPGVISIANAVFGLEPAIETDILAKAFQVDESVASLIQSNF
ncbi:putative germin-like protein 2-3 [Capsicum baccatum]|uniref:Germin-like protein 2-3 n=1 Tax=Capsicum baccatum TaxID=33114 RepID=A0A2G2VWJ1_CAPBA|nr:putative germin-like protein 2-3 [Capsicum baccatum]